MRKKTSVSTWNNYRVGHKIVEQSPTVIVLTTKTWIIHRVNVYYMIELFELFRSVSCVLYGILDTRNLDLSLRDLLAYNYIEGLYDSLPCTPFNHNSTTRSFVIRARHKIYSLMWIYAFEFPQNSFIKVTKILMLIFMERSKPWCLDLWKDAYIKAFPGFIKG